MQKGLAILLILFLFLKVNAQDNHLPSSSFHGAAQNNRYSAVSSDSLPTLYIGLGTGLNNYVGIIGVGLDVRIYKPLFIRGGVGIGTWGAKLTAGLRYELHPGKGWAFGVAYSRCFGITNFQDQLPIDTVSATSVTKLVTLDLNPASTLNFTASYNWIFHKHNKFYIEFGYAFPLQSPPYVVKNGVELASTSKETLDIIGPGGFVFALGVMFKLQ